MDSGVIDVVNRVVVNACRSSYDTCMDVMRGRIAVQDSAGSCQQWTVHMQQCKNQDTCVEWWQRSCVPAQLPLV
jgi:hypothetical protein